MLIFNGKMLRFSSISFIHSFDKHVPALIIDKVPYQVLQNPRTIWVQKENTAHGLEANAHLSFHTTSVSCSFSLLISLN